MRNPFDSLYQFRDQLPRRQLLSTIIKGSGMAFSIQAIGAVLAYLLQVVFARWIGQEGYGSFVFAYNAAQVLAVFGAVGLTISTLKFLPQYLGSEDWKHIKGLLYSARVIVLSVGSALALLAFFLIVPDPRLELSPAVLVIGLCLIPLIALKDLQTEIIRSLDHIALAYAPPYILQPLSVATVAIIFLTVTNQLTAVYAIWSLAVSILIVLVAQVLIIRKETGQSSNVQSAYSIREWLQPSPALLLVQGAVVVSSRADVLIVGWILGAEEAGIYSAATRSALLISFALIAVNAVIAPKIAPLYNKKDFLGLQKLVSAGTSLAVGVASIAALGMISLSGQILALFGEGFQVAQSALVILSIGQVINVATGPVGYLLHLTGNQKISAIVYSGSAVLGVCLSLLLVPRMGINGAAIATAIAISVQNIAMYIFVRKILAIDTLRLNA